MKFENIKKKYLNKVKDKLNIESGKAEKILKTCNNRLDKHSGLNKQQQKIRFETILKQFLYKKMSSGAENYEGLIIMTDEIRRINENKINQVLEDYKDPVKKDELLEEGEVKIIDDEPVVIDTRKEFSNGNKNFNYGKPLEVQPRKTLGGIVKIENSEGNKEYRKMNLTLSNDDVKKDVVFGRVCKFRATRGRTDEDGTVNLYSEEGTDIKYLDDEVDILKIARKFYSKEGEDGGFFKISEIKKMAKKEKNRWRVFFFDAELVSDNSQSPKPNITVAPRQDLDSLLNSDIDLETVYVKLPQDLALGFDCAVGAPIIIAGQCWFGDDDFFGVSAKGVFYDETKVETKPVEEVEEQEENDEEDW